MTENIKPFERVYEFENEKLVHLFQFREWNILQHLVVIFMNIFLLPGLKRILQLVRFNIYYFFYLSRWYCTIMSTVQKIYTEESAGADEPLDQPAKCLLNKNVLKLRLNEARVNNRGLSIQSPGLNSSPALIWSWYRLINIKWVSAFKWFN